MAILGVVCRGHGVASGASVGQRHNPYPSGTIAMQAPFFKALGLDLTGLKLATLNVDIAPQVWQFAEVDYCFEHLLWTHLHPPETFSFVAIEVQWQSSWHKGWIYRPHPDTKAAHFQSQSIVELILPPLTGIKTGDALHIRRDRRVIPVPASAGTDRVLAGIHNA